MVAYDMESGELELGQTWREVEPRPEAVGLGVG